MSFRNIVQAFRIKAPPCAGTFTNLTIIISLGVLGAHANQTYPFKGIDPPFSPPKNFISESMMNPKRRLVFMQTDQTTGTKFSLVNVIGGLPGGIPCVGGVNWPRGYEIVGQVPLDIDLTDDTVARSLVNKGKAVLFSFCPSASTTEPLAVWLFKGEVPTTEGDNYEVNASWVKQLPRAPGPEIRTEYHNKASERAEFLTQSRVREPTRARQSSTLPESFSAPTSNTAVRVRDSGTYIIELIGGVILFVILLIIASPFVVFAFFFCLIIGPIASVFILYVSHTTNTPLADEHKALLTGTALAWIGFIIYVLIVSNRGKPAISSGSTEGYSSGGYSSYDYGGPDSEPESSLHRRKERKAARCPGCDGVEIFSIPEKGNGVCSVCHGSGETLLDSINNSFWSGRPAKCWSCHDGNGQCRTCGGTGVV